MTTGRFSFKVLPSAEKLHELATQLDGKVKLYRGVPKITFEIDVERENFDGDCESWVDWCELAVQEHVRSYCPELDEDDNAMLAVFAQDPPDEVLEEQRFAIFARSLPRGYARCY